MPSSIDYIKPIIDAFTRSAMMQHQHSELEQQKVKDKETERRNQAQEQYQQDALKQARDIADQNFAHLQDQTDIQREIQKLHEKVAHADALHKMGEDISTGLQNPQSSEQSYDFPDLGVTIPKGSIMVDNEAVPKSQFETPQGRLARLKAQAVAVGQGQFEGLKDPEQKQKDAAAQAILDKKEGQETKEKQLDRQNRLEIARIMANARGVKEGIDPDIIQTLGEGAATGQTDLRGKTKSELAAMKYLQDTGQKQFTKKQSDSLKAIGSINSFFDQIDKFADDNLYDSKTGAYISGKFQKATGVPTETKNQLDILKQSAIPVGKAIEGISAGRLTNKQLELLINGMASTGKTKQQVKDDAEGLRSKFKTSVNQTILGGYSPEQREKILDAHGLTEADISGNPTGSKSTTSKPGRIVYTKDPSGKIVQVPQVTQ